MQNYRNLYGKKIVKEHHLRPQATGLADDSTGAGHLHHLHTGCHHTKEGTPLLLVSSPTAEYVYPLDKDDTIQIKGLEGITEIHIQQGQASYINSPCANKTHGRRTNSPQRRVVRLPAQRHLHAGGDPRPSHQR